MKKTDAPDVNKESPTFRSSATTETGRHKSYRVFRISARNRDYVIYSADEDTFYKVGFGHFGPVFDMPPIKRHALMRKFPVLY